MHTGANAFGSGAALLPDKGGNPDKPIGAHREKALHGPCNPLARAFHRRFKGLVFEGIVHFSYPPAPVPSITPPRLAACLPVGQG